MQFLSSYNNDVGEIEHALAGLQEKDQKIKSLTTTIRELKRSNSEEIQGLKAEASEAARRWTELEHQKARFKEDQEVLKKQIEQEKVKQTSFIQQQERKFEKKLEEERDKLVKANASQFERLKRENTKLNEKIGTLNEEKAQIEKTLKLYVQNSNALESQVDELKLRYPTQSLPSEH
jgi:chromosome segregation ATPase